MACKSQLPRLALLVGFLTSSGVTAFGADGPQIVEKYRRGVVSLTAYRGPLDQRTGTGFLIGKDVIITNEHVVGGARSVYADFYGNSESVECELIDSDSDLDLAALRLGKQPKNAYPMLTLCTDPAAEALQGEDIFIIGHPLRLNWSVIKGIIAGHKTLGDLFRTQILKVPPKDEAQRIIQLDVSSTFGMSGAPVINLKECVVGVQRLGYKEGEFGINFCIPADYIKQLNLEKEPQKFAGGDGPVLQNNLQALGIRNPGDAPAPGAFNINTRAWGFVPNDANVIFADFIGDKEGFAKIIKKSILDEIIGKGGGQPSIVHLTNPFFRYSVLSPNWFHIEEFASADRQSMKSVITYDDPQIPPGLNRVFIFAKKVKPPGPGRAQLLQAFENHCAAITTNELGLQVVDPNNPPPNPTNKQVALNANLSDADPVPDPFKPVVRVCRVYDAPVNFNQSYFVLYGLSGDSFVTMTFEFQTSEAFKQANWNVDWVERLFIAASLSFFD